MGDSKVSIIIPVYNVEPYIERCIESVLAQDCWNIEIILGNDGTASQSDSIIQKIGSDNKRIIIVNQGNKGVLDERNAEIEKASGEWVTFVDGDIFVTVWNKMYRTDMLRQNKIRFNEDIWYGEGMFFYIQCLQYVNDVAFGKRSIYHQTFNNKQ